MPGFADAASERRNGGHCQPAVAGQPTWRRRRVPQGSRPKGRDMAAALESASVPATPAHGLMLMPVRDTHSLPMPSRSRPYPGYQPGAWRAGGAPLKPFVEKVVTVQPGLFDRAFALLARLLRCCLLRDPG